MVRATVSFEILDAFAPGDRQAGQSRWVAPGKPQRSQAALRETLLVSSQRTGRIAERLSHIILIGPT